MTPRPSIFDLPRALRAADTGTACERWCAESAIRHIRCGRFDRPLLLEGQRPGYALRQVRSPTTQRLLVLIVRVYLRRLTKVPSRWAAPKWIVCTRLVHIDRTRGGGGTEISAHHCGS